MDTRYKTWNTHARTEVRGTRDIRPDSRDPRDAFWRQSMGHDRLR